MAAAIKKIIKWLAPTGITQLRYNRYRSQLWKGDFPSWQDASKTVSGYNSDKIFNKVLAATNEVRSGAAAYERDSVLFAKAEYAWQPLTAFYMAALQNNGKLAVLDFGGGLGSSYFQNRKLLQGLQQVDWNIVEQGGFVDIGMQKIQNEELHFYKTMKQCFAEKQINVLFFSSVLQYLEEPYRILEEVLTLKPAFLVFDRFSVINRPTDRITVQTVPPEIYEASYPCRFFNENQFLSFLEKHYELIADFDSSIANDIHFPNGDHAHDKGYIFKVRN